MARGNVPSALAAARDLPQLSLVDALELTVLVARKDPRRHPRVAERTVALGPVAADRLFEHRARTAFSGDDDRVFCHPETGGPLSARQYAATFRLALANFREEAELAEAACSAARRSPDRQSSRGRSPDDGAHYPLSMNLRAMSAWAAASR
jgi:hypothetical protein